MLVTYVPGFGVLGDYCRPPVITAAEGREEGTLDHGTPDHGAPSRPPGRAHQLPVLRELGWATWAGSEPRPGDPNRHKHDAEGVPFFAHSHNDGADAHDHMPSEVSTDDRTGRR